MGKCGQDDGKCGGTGVWGDADEQPGKVKQHHIPGHAGVGGKCGEIVEV